MLRLGRRRLSLESDSCAEENPSAPASLVPPRAAYHELHGCYLGLVSLVSVVIPSLEHDMTVYMVVTSHLHHSSDQILRRFEITRVSNLQGSEQDRAY